MSEQFDPRELKGAVAAVNTAFEEFKKANDQRLAEIEAKGAADPLLEEKLTKIDADMTKAQKRLDDYELSLKRKARVVTDANGNEIDLDKKAYDWAAQVASRRGKAAPEGFNAEKMEEYKAAFSNFIRNEEAALTIEERKALSSGSDPDGGYTIHPDMSGRLIAQVYETSIMRAYANVVTTGSNEYQGIYDNDQADYEWAGETSGRSETSTPQFKTYSIPLRELSALPKATQRLLDDSIFDIEAWLAGKIASRFARAENTSFVVGNGVNQPRGYLTYPDGSDLTNSIERITTGVNGDFAASPNGGDALIEMVGSLKADYIGNASWFMNRNSITKVRKLKNSDGSYMWQQSIAAGRPSTLLGYDVAPAFSDMPDFATGALPIAFGDMRAAYTIVDRMGIRMLRDPYSSKPNVLFYATKRVGGDMVNGEALKLLEASA